MNEFASMQGVARHADPVAFLTAAAPVMARDEALASSYVAFANGLLRNRPAETESVYLATFAAGGGAGAAMMRGTGGLWVGLLIGVILIMGGLTFLPSLALGPIADHLAMISGTLS